MRWITYFILAYVALGLQVGAGPFLRYQGASPNLVLLAVLFITINAPRDAALLGAFCLGALQDLLTQQPPGMFAFSYGLVAMFVVSTHHALYRENPLTHATLALIGGLMTLCVLMLHGLLHHPTAVPTDGGAALPALRLSLGLEFTRVVYTAALAPLVLGGLQRMRWAFGFQTTRRKVRAW